MYILYKSDKNKDSVVLEIARLSSWITTLHGQSTFYKSNMDNWSLLVIPQTHFM